MLRFFGRVSRLCISYFILVILLDALHPLLWVESSELINYDGSKEAAAGVKPSLVSEKDGKDTDASLINKERNIDYNFLHAFFASISVIIVSELGDKTFFIAAIMAMRHPRVIIFLGAIAALGLMTVLSVFLGYATTVIPRKYTFYISTALFALFGLKMLKEGYDMDPNEGQEELEEVSAELKKKEAELQSNEGQNDVETGIIRSQLRRTGFTRIITRVCSPIFLQAFTLTFLAEWGDRSQLTTIILGSRENPLGVSIGGTIGHALCTGLAVMGGRLIAQKISVRTVTLVGGVVFLIFAASALFIGDEP